MQLASVLERGKGMAEDFKVASLEKNELEALVEQFRNLPHLNREVFALQEAVRRAAKSGNMLAQECFDEDPAKMLTKMRDAFMFRFAFPEWTDAGEK